MLITVLRACVEIALRPLRIRNESILVRSRSLRHNKPYKLEKGRAICWRSAIVLHGWHIFASFTLDKLELTLYVSPVLRGLQRK